MDGALFMKNLVLKLLISILEICKAHINIKKKLLKGFLVIAVLYRSCRAEASICIRESVKVFWQTVFQEIIENF